MTIQLLYMSESQSKRDKRPRVNLNKQPAAEPKSQVVVKKTTSIVVDDKTWTYYFSDQLYDFRIYITDPNRKEHVFHRSFYRKGWSKKIRKPFVTPELVKRYIKMFVNRSQ